MLARSSTRSSPFDAMTCCQLSANFGQFHLVRTASPVELFWWPGFSLCRLPVWRQMTCVGPKVQSGIKLAVVIGHCVLRGSSRAQLDPVCRQVSRENAVPVLRDLPQAGMVVAVSGAWFAALT